VAARVFGGPIISSVRFLKFLFDLVVGRHLSAGDILLIDPGAVAQLTAEGFEVMSAMMGGAKVTVRLLPDYSPELNPCDLVFQLIKERIVPRHSSGGGAVVEAVEGTAVSPPPDPQDKFPSFQQTHLEAPHVVPGSPSTASPVSVIGQADETAATTAILIALHLHLRPLPQRCLHQEWKFQQTETPMDRQNRSNNTYHRCIDEPRLQ
jgi:hypothetical protein